MPLIDVTLRPGLRLEKIGGRRFKPESTRLYVRKAFGPRFPATFVLNSAKFGMDEGTPANGVQVQFHDYGPDDINVANLWIKVQFNEEQPNKAKRIEIRNAVFEVIVDALHADDVKVPDNFVLDVLWGPTSGCGSVNGTFIEW